MSAAKRERPRTATGDRKRLPALVRLLVLASILEALEGTGGDRRRRRPRKRATGRKKRGGGVKIEIQTS